MDAPSASVPGACAPGIPRLIPGVELQRLDGGLVRLRGAPFRRGAVHRLVARWLRLPERIEVELDELGAFVVTRCDGRDLETLAGDLAGHLRLTRREARVALADFLRLLERRRLVRLVPA